MRSSLSLSNSNFTVPLMNTFYARFLMLCLAVLPLFQMSIYAQTLDDNLVRIADELYAEGVRLYTEGKYSEAKLSFERCDAIESENLPDTLTKRSYLPMWIGACHYKMGDEDTAAALTKYYYAPVDRRLTVKSDSLAIIGTGYLRQQKYAEAQRYYEDCAKIEKELLGELSPWYGNSMFNLLDIYANRLYFESYLVIDSLIGCLNDYAAVLSANPIYAQNSLKFSIGTIDFFCNLFSSINDQSQIKANEFYKAIIAVYNCTKNVPFLSELDEKYGRAVEAYSNYLYSCSKETENIALCKDVLENCNMHNVFNANSIIVELSWASLCMRMNQIDLARQIYLEVFSGLDSKLDYSSRHQRIWMESRLERGMPVFEKLGLTDLWDALAEKCSSNNGFEVEENIDFVRVMANRLRDQNEFGKAHSFLALLCDRIRLEDNPSRYDIHSDFAYHEYKQGNYLAALQLYQYIEKYADFHGFDRSNIYERICWCYEKLEDSENYRKYSNKLKTYLENLLSNELSEENIDRESLSKGSLQMLNALKSIAYETLHEFYFNDGELDKVCDVLQRALAYYKKIGDYYKYCSTLISFGEAYGFTGYKKYEISNDYLNQVIDLTYSWETELFPFACSIRYFAYELMANNYESMSPEPEMAIECYKKGIDSVVTYICELIRSNKYSASTINSLITPHFLSLKISIRNLSDIGELYHSYNYDYVLDTIQYLIDVAGDYMAPQDTFEMLHDCYCVDIVYNYHIGNRELCESKLAMLEDIYRLPGISASTINLLDLGDVYKLLGYDSRALDCYKKIQLGSDKMDHIYWRAERRISEINGDHNWMYHMKDELDDNCNLTNLYFILESFRFSLDVKELDDYCIDLCRRIITGYADGKSDIDIESVYDILMFYCLKNGRYEILKDYYKSCAESGINSTKSGFQISSFNKYNEYDGKGLGELLTLAYPDQSFDSGTIYNSVMFRKNSQLSVSLSLSNLIKESTDSLLIKKYARYERLKMALNVPGDSISDLGRVISRDEAYALMERFEDEIRQGSRYHADFTESLNATWEDVQATLKKDEVAIEFTYFTDIEGRGQYGAVILRSSENPVFVSLFDSLTLNKLMSEDRYLNEKLYDVLWKPILNCLDDFRTIYVAPDGTLHNIPFEYALYNGDISEGDIRVMRLSTTRELVDRLKRADTTVENMVMFGGINYDLLPKGKKESGSYVLGRGVVNTVDYLPGTLQEVKQIKKYCQQRKVNATLYAGKKAGESKFKELSNKPIDVLHIATHGYYVPEGVDLTFNLSSKLDSLSNSDEELALLRVGLLMAGANYYNYVEPSTIEDGVLTAHEIAQLDLHKVDFAVLSACETGLGDISGEGVYGLPRAFKKAGVNCILMSLWSVDDAATEAFMNKFYECFLSGMSKYQSLMQAQQYVRSHEQWKAPKYWAGFILLDDVE